MLSIIIFAAFFGVKFAPSETNMPSLAKMVPINDSNYVMTQPDGVVRHFRRQKTGSDIFIGNRPWMAKIQKRHVDVWADPGHTGGKLRTAFSFVDGSLRQLLLDGKKYKLPKFSPEGRVDVSALWPEKDKIDLSKNGKGDIWGDHGRMRLWYANPNSAGMLCAEITLLFIFLATKFYKLPRIGFLLAAIACLILTMQTGSRGALLAVVVGVAFGFADQIRKLARPRNIGWFIMIAAIAFGALYLTGNLGHYLKTFYTIDESNSLRIKVAKAALAMFADAPFGWHGGRFFVREVMLNWYLPGVPHTLKTHFTNLAGSGWILGLLYCWFWIFIVIVGCGLAKRGYRLWLMIWSAFAVAGFLNPVYAKSLWILPLGISLFAFIHQSSRILPREAIRSGCIASIGSLASVLLLVFVGNFCGRDDVVHVKPCGQGVVVNGAKPKIWVVTDELVFGNSAPGRAITKFFLKNPETEPVGFVAEVRHLPVEAETLVLCGRAAADFIKRYQDKPNSTTKAKKILFLNPSISYLDIPASLVEKNEIEFFAGGVLVRESSEYAVNRQGIHVLNGVEFFVPDAMQLILAHSYTPTPKERESNENY